MSGTVKKKKRGMNARILWLILIVLAVIFYIVFVRMPMFPSLWKMIALVVLLVIIALTGFLSIRFYKNFFVKFLDVLLCLVLAAASVFLPYAEKKVTALFSDLTTTQSTVSLYTLNSDYRAAHPELGLITDVSTDLSHYHNAVFITCYNNDEENMSYAMNQVNSVCGDVETLDCDSVISEAAQLYNGAGHVMLLSGTMISMVTDAYPDFLNDTTVITTFSRDVKNEVTGDSDLTSQPFTIFFGGNDEEGDLSTVGRTDVDMLVTVNPKTYQISIISLPRDSYIPNPACDNQYDKLTHLGLYGIDNTLSGLSSWFGMDSDVFRNYVVVNFTTFRNIIDALGGVDVDNDIEFTALNQMEYPKGKIHLEGEYALMYVRERKTFVNGDFERNYHQQLVMSAIIDKLTSPAIITRFSALMDGLKGKFLTNISSDALYDLCAYQLANSIKWNVVKYQVLGDVGEAECASAPGYNLSVVYPYENQRDFAANVITSVINGETVTQETMPDGISSDTSQYDSSYSDGSDSSDETYDNNTDSDGSTDNYSDDSNIDYQQDYNLQYQNDGSEDYSDSTDDYGYQSEG